MRRQVRLLHVFPLYQWKDRGFSRPRRIRPTFVAPAVPTVTQRSIRHVSPSNLSIPAAASHPVDCRLTPCGRTDPDPHRIRAGPCRFIVFVIASWREAWAVFACSLEQFRVQVLPEDWLQWWRGRMSVDDFPSLVLVGHDPDEGMRAPEPLAPPSSDSSRKIALTPCHARFRIGFHSSREDGATSSADGGRCPAPPSPRSAPDVRAWRAAPVRCARCNGRWRPPLPACGRRPARRRARRRRQRPLDCGAAAQACCLLPCVRESLWSHTASVGSSRAAVRILTGEALGLTGRISPCRAYANGFPWSTKYSRVTLNTMGASSSSPMRFGTAINPLRVSDRFQTKSTLTFANESAARTQSAR